MKLFQNNGYKMSQHQQTHFYYLGVAEEGNGNLTEAKKHLSKAVVLNARDLDAMVALTRVAYAQKDINALESLEAPIRLLDSNAADVVVIHIKALY